MDTYPLKIAEAKGVWHLLGCQLANAATTIGGRSHLARAGPRLLTATRLVYRAARKWSNEP